ncbi:MAG: GAF domain-containing protein [Pseudomonadota bacterium]
MTDNQNGGYETELDRLRRELEESMNHNRAAAEVLKVISGSPRSMQPVYEAIVQSAAELCGVAYCAIVTYDGTNLDLAATYNFTAEVLPKTAAQYPMQPNPNRSSGRAILERRTFHSSDLFNDPSYPCLGPLKLCHYLVSSWRYWHGSEALFGRRHPEAFA